MTLKKRLGTTGYYVVSTVIAVVSMFPFLWMISTSLKSQGAIMSIPIQWIPQEPSGDAYVEVFTKFNFLRTVGNSLFISVSYTVITLLSSAMAAFAFAKVRFRGNDLLLKLYLATMMIPTQVTMIPLFVIMNKLGLINSFLCPKASPLHLCLVADTLLKGFPNPIINILEQRCPRSGSTIRSLLIVKRKFLTRLHTAAAFQFGQDTRGTILERGRYLCWKMLFW